MIIAVDGPAAAGKGTLARKIAAKYALAFLDTGMLYRGVAWMVLDAGGDPADAETARRAAEAFDLEKIDELAIRTPEVGSAASIVAAQSDVRRALFDFQRRFAASPPGVAKGAVLDGRDIGTIVCPDADVKLFVTAAPEIRARRRWLELTIADPRVDFDTVLAQVKARDARDAARAAAPMTAAADAVLLDTSELSIDAAFTAACRIIDGARLSS